MRATTLDSNQGAGNASATAAPLFEPLAVAGLTLRNRIVVAPMCQYSAQDGSATDWHAVHLGTLALSGAALVTVEATGVEPRGRITPHCLGLYSDANEEALARVLAVVRAVSDTPLGIQIGHAGRKASTARPWEGRMPLTAAQGAWETIAPSPIPAVEGGPAAREMTEDDMGDAIAAHKQAAERALRLGFDWIEIHSAHGYLLSSFLSPLSNHRTDQYGGSIENRMRFPLQVARAVREAWPAGRPMSAKINGTDWAEGGISPEDMVTYARALSEAGVDVVVASGGGIVETAKVPAAPGYQVPFAERVKREAGVITGAVGLITEPHFAQSLIADGKADLVYLARGFLFDPRWARHAAAELGVDLPYPPQYDRASPPKWAPGRDFHPWENGADRTKPA